MHTQSPNREAWLIWDRWVLSGTLGFVQIITEENMAIGVMKRLQCLAMLVVPSPWLGVITDPSAFGMRRLNRPITGNVLRHTAWSLKIKPRMAEEKPIVIQIIHNGPLSSPLTFYSQWEEKIKGSKNNVILFFGWCTIALSHNVVTEWLMIMNISRESGIKYSREQMWSSTQSIVRSFRDEWGQDKSFQSKKDCFIVLFEKHLQLPV